MRAPSSSLKPAGFPDAILPSQDHQAKIRCQTYDRTGGFQGREGVLGIKNTCDRLKKVSYLRHQHTVTGLPLLNEQWNKYEAVYFQYEVQLRQAGDKEMIHQCVINHEHECQRYLDKVIEYEGLLECAHIPSTAIASLTQSLQGIKQEPPHREITIITLEGNQLSSHPQSLKIPPPLLPHPPLSGTVPGHITPWTFSPLSESPLDPPLSGTVPGHNSPLDIFAPVRIPPGPSPLWDRARS
ncbi:hypothetical protein GWK47_046860 [Chionoecetes opilio]|uniref:Uncharacterized protein n=1 Tax=Chionoecetes opilio TaxID=41210 RepID=A0A8J5CW53_CHIOP|nr:hypothetical protein GWK47_046860 [Chionoecetes opilio]